MEVLRNLPTGEPEQLAGLIAVQPGRVAFGDGESVSEECYFGDTLYYVLEGGLSVTLEGAVRQLRTGDCLAVPAGTSHAVAAPESCKLLQITLS